MSEGTASNPLPARTTVIEPKVKWGAIGTYVVGALLMFIVNLVTGNGNELLMAVVPDYLEMFIVPLIPALASLASGYAARHQYRSPETAGGPTGRY